jgi:hypothetical protein
MNSLQDTETAVAIAVPQAAGTALKALKDRCATAEQQAIAYNFIVYELCGILKAAFALHGGPDAINWYNGRRFVGLQIENIATTPMDEPEIALPPARTITEAVRRRDASGLRRRG